MDVIPSEGFHSREMDFWFRVLRARGMRRRVGGAALMGSDFDVDSSYGVFFYIPEGWDGHIMTTSFERDPSSCLHCAVDARDLSHPTIYSNYT